MGQLLCDCCPRGATAPEGTVEEATFDGTAKSATVVLSADGRTASGTGVALVSCALHQDQCYFELWLVKLSGEVAFCVGVAQRSPEVTAQAMLGDGERSWCFSSAQSTEPWAEGDVLGCLFDQSSGRPQMALFRNGQALPPGTEVKGFRGVVHPAVSFQQGCEMRCNFAIEPEGFKHRPPQGVTGLIPSRSLV
jgi:hypothetical protein